MREVDFALVRVNVFSERHFHNEMLRCSHIYKQIQKGVLEIIEDYPQLEFDEVFEEIKATKHLNTSCSWETAIGAVRADKKATINKVIKELST